MIYNRVGSVLQIKIDAKPPSAVNDKDILHKMMVDRRSLNMNHQGTYQLRKTQYQRNFVKSNNNGE